MEANKSFSLLVIGAGMYVAGRGTAGFGTILPAVFDWIKKSSHLDVRVSCAATSINSINEFSKKAEALSLLTGVSVNISTYPTKEVVDINSYKEALLNIEQPAAAIIVVPDHLHHQITMDCLNAGLHTLVVKPLAPSLRECLDLVEVAKKKELYGMVEFHKRWDKSNLILKNKIHSQALGDLLYCHVEYSQRKSIPTSFFKSWASKTNILQYLGIHYIDLVRYLTNAMPIRVLAIGQKSYLTMHDIDTYDSIQCLIEWRLPNKKIFNQTILANWIDPETSSAMSNQTIKFIGTKGRYEADQKNRGITLNIDGDNLEHINPDFCMPIKQPDGLLQWQGYGVESIHTFLNDVMALKNSDTSLSALSNTRPTFKESLVSAAVIDAANLSLDQNGSWHPVSLDESQVI